MNKFILITVILAGFIFITFLYPQDQWVRLNSPTTQTLTHVSFVDSSNGWACGDTGTIVHTSDAGFNWDIQNSKVNYEIRDIFFQNINTGWAIALNSSDPPYGTIILKTTNGGTNWDTSSYPVNEVFFNTIYFLDSLDGFMGGYGGALIKTTDGGGSWYQVQIDTGVVSHLPIVSINFYNHQYGFACGGSIDISGVIWKTTDYGEFWVEKSVTADPINALHFLDSAKVIGCGGDFEYGTGILKTTNAGTNWNYTSLSTFGIAYAMSFRTPNEIWCPLGYAAKFIFSTDTGRTWNTIFTPDTSSVYDLTFPDSLTGYAVGGGGAIFKYKVTGITPVELVSFNEVYSGGHVKLKWETATETNNHGFEIQKSIDKIRWETIGFVKGNGTSTKNHTYSYIDKSGGTGLYYYRLKQIDFNGKYEYSNILEATIYPPLQYNLSQNYPNPFNPTTIIKYSIPNSGNVKILIYDMLGRIVKTLVNDYKQAGTYKIRFDGSSLSSGIYIYKMIAGEKSLSKKMVLMK
jgi:photosystem II stability/assembly factor-like uncharacterized protein